MIIYLHGFRSGPQSWKSRALKARMDALGLGEAFWCEQLPVAAPEAIALVEAQIARCSTPPTLVGSSLGGYYATWLAERYGCRAALLNPAVLPADDLAGYVGEHTMYHSSEPFEWRAEYLQELLDLRIERITQPERYFLLAATGDEVLDWRQMRDHYAGARQHIIEGSDHAISEFARYANELVLFCVDG